MFHYFTKGDNFYDFLFAFLVDVYLPKWVKHKYNTPCYNAILNISLLGEGAHLEKALKENKAKKRLMLVCLDPFADRSQNNIFH